MNGRPRYPAGVCRKGMVHTMKGLAKINRGLLLTAAVVIAAVAYILIVTAGQNAQKRAIEKVCQDYIETAVTYSMLPAQERQDKPTITTARLNDYMTEMDGKIGQFYPAGSAQLGYALKSMKNSLKSQAEGQDVIFSYSKKIVKYTDFSFDGDTVTVTPSCLSTIETAGATGHSTSSQTTTDTIILQKTGGVWKVTYAYLTQPAPQQETPGAPYYKYAG